MPSEIQASGKGPNQRFSRIAHAAAVLTAFAILPLIFVGAGVTSKDAGMAFPDWPTSDGHFVNPPGWLQNDHTLWEHSHRLIGWTVGMFAIASAVMTWRSGGFVRVFGSFTLFAIIVQGVLGGMRVREISTLLAMFHGIWGQLCLCLAVTTALITSRPWMENRTLIEVPTARFLQRLCLIATVLTFMQLVAGATFRHFSSSTALAVHLVGAVIVAFVIGWKCLWVLGQHPGRTMLTTPAKALSILMVIQLLLGGNAFLVVMMPKAWSSLLHWLVPTAHTAVGALLLACSFGLTLAVYRVVRPSMARESISDSVIATAVAS